MQLFILRFIHSFIQSFIHPTTLPIPARQMRCAAVSQQLSTVVVAFFFLAAIATSSSPSPSFFDATPIHTPTNLLPPLSYFPTAQSKQTTPKNPHSTIDFGHQQKRELYVEFEGFLVCYLVTGFKRFRLVGRFTYIKDIREREREREVPCLEFPQIFLCVMLKGFVKV